MNPEIPYYTYYQWADEWVEPDDTVFASAHEYSLWYDDDDSDPGAAGIPRRPRPHAPAGSAALVLA